MILAHGAAGGWDELVLVLCPLVFLGILVIAGRRRRPPPADRTDQSDAVDRTDAGD